MMAFLNRLWDMNGYGHLVWPAYAVTALIVFCLWLSSWRGFKRAQKHNQHARSLLPPADLP